ncbi:DUF3500 domain-containing protein [Planctomycetes bacterium K23_9]|uniref:DUF3500 domain-containing protein n=1 Tax=Stieleria marina TaxID=1930275 RepID=A0A517NQI1_9BACT|nr:hypothetical protein K239x_13340 [Planctomycetes bacterium K23_9]
MRFVRLRSFRLYFAASICLAALAITGLKVSDPPGVQAKTFADSFLSSLDEDQKAKAIVPYDSDQRVDWHFIPKKTRKGLALRDMNSAQRSSALRLIRATLSEAGYDKASKTMLMEAVVRELEGEKRNWERDPQKYFVTFFGQPSDKDPWGLSIEGHHLSLNFSYRDGKVADSTPQFFGANPGEVKTDVPGPFGKGTRVLKSEEQIGFKLINALSKENQAKAIIDKDAPKELRFAGDAQVDVEEPVGIALSELSEENQKTLKRLVRVYTDIVPEPLAKGRRSLINQDGWDDVHFAWSGAKKPGIGHYYRIRGKRFLIEFVNTQADAEGNPANHIHCCWRDVSGDFDLPAGK